MIMIIHYQYEAWVLLTSKPGTFNEVYFFKNKDFFMEMALFPLLFLTIGILIVRDLFTGKIF